MKLLNVMFAVAVAIAASGCVVHEQTGYDPHRQWWAEHHGGEAYDRGRAEQEHRAWCERAPDRSCEGWR